MTTRRSAVPGSSLEIEQMPIEAVVPYARNPRKNAGAVAKVMASIKEYGFRQPIVVDAEHVVVVGHTRLEAARRLKMTHVPVHVARELTAQQAKAYRLADNRTHEEAEWDEVLLKLELEELRDGGADLGPTGFDALELNELFSDLKQGNTDADDAPPLEEVAVSVPGDVWLLGKHRIVCGDCTVRETVSAALGGAKPRLMVTDPPYGVNYDAQWRQDAGLNGPEAAKGLVKNDDRADWREAWALFPGDVAYVWHGGLHSTVVAESLKAARFGLRAQIIWVKQRLVIGRGHYQWQHEPCFYGVRDEARDDHWRFVPEHEVAAYAVREGKTADWAGNRKQSTVWHIEHVKSETGHGTQKPVEAMRRPIENNSAPGAHVYEPFSGSGTTIMACEQTDRICHAVELDPRYVDVAVRRWEAFTGKLAVRERDKLTFAAVSGVAGGSQSKKLLLTKPKKAPAPDPLGV